LTSKQKSLNNLIKCKRTINNTLKFRLVYEEVSKDGTESGQATGNIFPLERGTKKGA